LGPIDATIRESLLAPARITIQCRDTERTHRAGRFADDFAGKEAVGAGFVDATSRGLTGALTGGVAVGAGAGSLTTLAGAALTGTMVSIFATVGCEGELSVVAITVCASAVSAVNGAEADAGGATFDDAGAALSVPPF
jgi:hypothetical protein